MRSFVGFVVVVTALVAALVLVVGPLVARPVIASLVQDALPIDQGEVTVEVDIGPSLLSGEVETIAIGGRDLRSGNTTIGLLQLDLTGFDLFSRTFKDVDGQLEDVEIRVADGTTVALRRLALRGPSDDLRATGMLDAVVVEQLVRAKLADQGIVADAVRLRDGQIEIDAVGMTFETRVSVHDGGVYLEAGRLPTSIALLEPESPPARWVVMSATVSPSGLAFDATTRIEAILGG